ncbi:MAG: hypothetical protein RMJ66_02955 [Bacteroidia bacterium]|nr:hypothetical protein [Bacteroidia bacterium]MDW8134005.1 hypothetical protein [Bacteroidia bacterium]
MLLVLLSLGVWYGWRGASYLWAAQWTVYITGGLFLWSWMALDSPFQAYPRWEVHSFWLAAGMACWWLLEIPLDRLLGFSFPLRLPSLAEVGYVWSRDWALFFAWLSVFLAILWLVIVILWEHPTLQKSPKNEA